MKEFRYCAHCSKNIRLSEDVGLSVLVGTFNQGNQGFVCELFLIVPESSPAVVVLYRWFYEREGQGMCDFFPEKQCSRSRHTKGQFWHCENCVRYKKFEEEMKAEEEAVFRFQNEAEALKKEAKKRRRRGAR